MPRPSKATEVVSDAALGSLRAFGARLREARLRRNWTQALTAGKAGLSESSVKKAETGSPNISTAAYVALLDVYGLPTALDTLLAPGSDAIGEAMQRASGRQRARAPAAEADEWDL